MMASGGNGGGSTGSTTFFRQFFEIQERLGWGSFGDVFRAKSKIDGKEYAVKKSRKTYSGEGDRLESGIFIHHPVLVYLSAL
jgi:serine/threonine protein kinase